jgi:hypothetical protein
MNEEDMYSYISQLWAMGIASNKRYVVGKMIKENSFETRWRWFGLLLLLSGVGLQLIAAVLGLSR